MENKNNFTYTYSAKENQEVLDIRKKYVAQEESKLEELKRLDRKVRNSGMTESLILGILSCLVFGVAMCFGLKVFGGVAWPCIPLGLVGAVGMIFAYPLYSKINRARKQEYAPRIIALADELALENSAE